MQMQPQYFSDRTLAARYEVSRATIWRWTANEQIPKPVKINGSTRWRLSDIQAWEAKQGGAA
ncbi:helix-turn-helix transcriptional regulator [Microbulbifer magnicolonia]|uniref:helix-turn-helix transcriptional regulator n=1 Tax=Microbulbifer magnicolonia TaxID=3109744 RepID=UPI002B4150F5|nr:helix-turn-helix domain-containing protein [Microbulbifer sp. GG15]